MNIGKTIAEIIKDKGVFQNYIAEKAGISPEHLSSIKNGNKNVTIETLEKISRALDTPLFALILWAMDEGDVSEENRKDFEKNRAGINVLIESYFGAKVPKPKRIVYKPKRVLVP